MNSTINKLKYRFNTATVVERIIYCNIAVFVLTYIVKAFAFLMQWDGNSLIDFFALPANFDTYISKFWTIVSYGFLHGDFLHLFFNLLFLYFLGRVFLDFFSKNQFLTYFFTGILAGGIIFLLSYNLLPALKGQAHILVGASAGVTAIVIGVATKVPNYAIHFRFIGAVKLWYIAVAVILIDIVQLPLSNTGGHLAHLGGALIGFLLTSQLNEGKNITSYFSNLFKPKKRTPLKTVYKKNKPSKASLDKTIKQRKIDSILDKISKSGYETLTQEEKDFLFSVGKK